MDYVIGVDGGNTKTDFVLADTHGRVLAALRGGTCSHEALPDCYAGARRELKYYLDQLLQQAGVPRKQVRAAVLGLAGADTPEQRERLEEIVSRFGFGRHRVINDSYLSILAVSEDGTGICSINGTGTVAGGIDGTGAMVQVGGLGITATGDSGGGVYYALRTVRAAYDQLFRNGPATTMTGGVLRLLEAGDGSDLLIHIREKVLDSRAWRLQLMRLLFTSCRQGDAVARCIVEQSARELADSVIGCAGRLRLPGTIRVVCAGSIWLKAETPLLYMSFCARLRSVLGERVVVTRLLDPPVCGAVQWALRDALGVDYRFVPGLGERITHSVRESAS